MTVGDEAVPVKGRLCAVPPAPVRPVPDSADPNRHSMIRMLEKKWINGTALKYHFMQGPDFAGPAKYQEVCRAAFDEWKGVGIGLSFQEVSEQQDADIRIAFVDGDGRCACQLSCLHVCGHLSVRVQTAGELPAAPNHSRLHTHIASEQHIRRRAYAFWLQHCLLDRFESIHSPAHLPSMPSQQLQGRAQKYATALPCSIAPCPLNT
jgi:Matrixin